MNIRTLIAAAGLTLTACGGGATPEAACEAYIASAVACIDEAYGDDADMAAMTAEALDGACDSVVSSSAAANAILVDQYNCYADVYTNGDCSTLEGYTAASGDLATCN